MHTNEEQKAEHDALDAILVALWQCETEAGYEHMRAKVERHVEARIAHAAERIERELICCDIFDRLSEKPGKTWTGAEVREFRAHSICYWGEASRRIVLNTSPEEG